MTVMAISIAEKCPLIMRNSPQLTADDGHQDQPKKRTRQSDPPGQARLAKAQPHSGPQRQGGTACREIRLPASPTPSTRAQITARQQPAIMSVAVEICLPGNWNLERPSEPPCLQGVRFHFTQQGKDRRDLLVPQRFNRIQSRCFQSREESGDYAHHRKNRE
jgi:hypothetical protein